MFTNPYLDPSFYERLKYLPGDKMREYTGHDGVLTPIQRLALPVIEWLISNMAGSGRTELMCHAFIKKAIETGEYIRPFDHHAPYDMTHNLNVNFRGRIGAILEKHYPEFQMTWRTSRHDFKLERR